MRPGQARSLLGEKVGGDKSFYNNAGRGGDWLVFRRAWRKALKRVGPRIRPRMVPRMRNSIYFRAERIPSSNLNKFWPASATVKGVGCGILPPIQISGLEPKMIRGGCDSQEEV